MAPQQLTRADVLGSRVRAHQLDRTSGPLAGTAVLDLGGQDTGPDAARWALAVRGLAGVPADDVALAWTLRGAPHARRTSTSSAGTCGCTVRVPTLHVWGDGDAYLGRAATEETGQFVDAPYALEVLAGVNHWVPELAAERTGELITAHVRSSA